MQRGTWLYDDTVPMPATIVQLDYDFWYEIGRADGDLEPREQPELSPEGVLYYVCFRSDPEEDPGWVDSPGFQTLAEARKWAASKVAGPIAWDATA